MSPFQSPALATTTAATASPTPPGRELPINDPPPADGSQPPVQDPPVQHPDPTMQHPQTGRATASEAEIADDWADDVNPEAHESAV